ncbi:CYTH domain-containing protein [Candidatus Saccharibacteria bacterium]|jgi:adenylate cyclase class 2|nr:CYTH domain-containing protein [Candidatus Saccharibacteria bacterium]
MAKNDIEYELRVLNIEKKTVETNIKALGGVLLAKQSFRRYVFDVIPKTVGQWLRLRTDGTKTTLTLKIISSDDVDGTSEWEVEVDDFDKTAIILEMAGITSKGYQENNRIEYKLLGARVAIDSWPQIPIYLEIEADDEKTVFECAEALGYAHSDLTGMNTQKIYSTYGIDLDTTPNLKF